MVRFWAKTTPDGKPGISVFEHMINVGCVARCIAGIWPEILEAFNLRSQEVGALAALHDLGKITPGFERKCEAWLVENGLLQIDRNGCWDTAMEPDHGVVSHSAIQDFLMEQGCARKLSSYLSALLGAHHGRIKSLPNPRGIRPPQIGQISEPASGIDWTEARRSNAGRVLDFFGADLACLTLVPESQVLWWLAGLTTVADWIGSDERFFPAGGGTGDAIPSACALKALDSIGLRRPELRPGLSFHDLFHDAERPAERWNPNKMQQNAVEAITGPGVYVIEAPMGMGKTEAALWAAYRILISGKATGIYFALPTQVTSNRIHLRLQEFIRRISPAVSPVRLIHGNSWLFQAEPEIAPTVTVEKEKQGDARAATDWFGSAKRALLAPFGVGTVDQALLSVVAAKHFFVRQFALAGKVVILDEIHSYDVYTGTLIDRLIATLEGLGCTVIVLSATLTGARRAEIVACPDEPSKVENVPYPLITGRKDGISIAPTGSPPPVPRDVLVEFVSPERAEANAIEAARQGWVVLWICNTVGAAQRKFQKLRSLFQQEQYPIGLLHSRFPFWRREQLEEDWMDRLGKSGKRRCGCILVATQVVEQSVDLDADLMITELAPTDMLLQRLGRLWRHLRLQRPAESPRVCILEEETDLAELRQMSPDRILKVLGSKAHVYAPFVLLRTLEVWKEQSRKLGTLSIPSQIRQLIENTYGYRENEPASWRHLMEDWCGRDAARKFFASRNCNLWQPALEDREGVQTRLNELKTCALVLCRYLADRDAEFVDGSCCRFERGRYQLATAQAVHKNLVKVPDYCFDQGISSIKSNIVFEEYLFGMQGIGIVSKNGTVEVKGLMKGIRLFYSDDVGLFIEKASAREVI